MFIILLLIKLLSRALYQTESTFWHFSNCSKPAILQLHAWNFVTKFRQIWKFSKYLLNLWSCLIKWGPERSSSSGLLNYKSVSYLLFDQCQHYTCRCHVEFRNFAAFNSNYLNYIGMVRWLQTGCPKYICFSGQAAKWESGGFNLEHFWRKGAFGWVLSKI